MKEEEEEQKAIEEIEIDHQNCSILITINPTSYSTSISITIGRLDNAFILDIYSQAYQRLLAKFGTRALLIE